ncbi:MAG: Uma2 family endonuclease [Chloroflexia bacterium]|nr:Uma2 family endonuclease [Chloroflexia bacterium]
MVATRLETVAEFEANAREGHWELIDGEPVEITPSAGLSSMIASRINGYVFVYLLDHPIGHAFASDGGFILFPDRDTVRAPDFAFIQRDRLPKVPASFIPMPPDLAVEVLSPTDRLSEALAKVAMYLEAGVSLVWLIDPRKRTATVFRQNELPETMGEDGALDGEEVLPGFTLPLAVLFS